ncbi:MAG: tRNA (guanosine(46)-N7)-methyltransferase TrmB, partial [Bauldia sp.]
PDPWPKRRHWKRRFVGPANLDRLARVLKPGGPFRFVSDIDSYVEWTLLHLQRRSDFAWTAEKADDWRLPFPGWPGTRYEAKALAAGRRPAYLAFVRT